MKNFKLYLRDKKIEFLKKCHEDFISDFNFELSSGAGFTRCDFFHFVVHEQIKFVHKESLKFILTNGDTYSRHERLEEIMQPNQEQKEIVLKDVERMFDFLRTEINQVNLFPKLLSETKNFFVFEYYDEDDWLQLEKLSLKDSVYIRHTFLTYTKNKKEIVTPFYNQMANKIFRNRKTGEVKMVDLKSLEFRKNGPLAILMNNKYVNDLYLLERRYWTKSHILKPFSIDYPVHLTSIIKHY